MYLACFVLRSASNRLGFSLRDAKRHYIWVGFEIVCFRCCAEEVVIFLIRGVRTGFISVL